MSALPRVKERITPQEYLRLDRAASYKSEYIDGEIVAMAGASLVHNLIVGNILGELHQQLRAGPCQVYPSDVRVLIPKTGSYVYPDVSIVCDEPQVADVQFDILLNPVFIVEVLSESTEALDRGKKFERYRRLDSLQEYLLVSQDEPHIDRYVRQPNGDWLLTPFSDLDGVVDLLSIGCHLSLVEVYRKVSFGKQDG